MAASCESQKFHWKVIADFIMHEHSDEPKGMLEVLREGLCPTYICTGNTKDNPLLRHWIWACLISSGILDQNLPITLTASTVFSILTLVSPRPGPGPPGAKSARCPMFTHFPVLPGDGSDGSFGEVGWLPLAPINGVPQLDGIFSQVFKEGNRLFINRLDTFVNFLEEAGHLVSGMSVTP